MNGLEAAQVVAKLKGFFPVLTKEQIQMWTRVFLASGRSTVTLMTEIEKRYLEDGSDLDTKALMLVTLPPDGDGFSPASIESRARWTPQGEEQYKNKAREIRLMLEAQRQPAAVLNQSQIENRKDEVNHV